MGRAAQGARSPALLSGARERTADPRRVSLNVGNLFLLGGRAVTEHWHRLPSRVSNPGDFLKPPDRALGHHLWVAAPERGSEGAPEVPAHLTPSERVKPCRAPLRSTRAEHPSLFKTARIVLKSDESFIVCCCCCLWLYGGEGLLGQTLIAASRPPVESCLCLKRESSRELHLIPPPFSSDVLSASNSRAPLLCCMISLC